MDPLPPPAEARFPLTPFFDGMKLMRRLVALCDCMPAFPCGSSKLVRISGGTEGRGAFQRGAVLLSAVRRGEFQQPDRETSHQKFGQ